MAVFVFGLMLVSALQLVARGPMFQGLRTALGRAVRTDEVAGPDQLADHDLLDTKLPGASEPEGEADVGTASTGGGNEPGIGSDMGSNSSSNAGASDAGTSDAGASDAGAPDARASTAGASTAPGEAAGRGSGLGPDASGRQDQRQDQDHQDQDRDGVASMEAEGLCLGDQVFIDLVDDNHFDAAGGDTGIASVQLRLYADRDGSGDLSPADEAMAETFSDPQGRYRFCNLDAGAYLVAIDAREFDEGATLSFLSSLAENDFDFAPDPNDDLDDDDNGAWNPAFQTVSSRAIELEVGQEPGASVDGDAETSNATLDFGFRLQARIAEPGEDDSEADVKPANPAALPDPWQPQDEVDSPETGPAPFPEDSTPKQPVYGKPVYGKPVYGKPIHGASNEEVSGQGNAAQGRAGPAWWYQPIHRTAPPNWGKPTLGRDGGADEDAGASAGEGGEGWASISDESSDASSDAATSRLGAGCLHAVRAGETVESIAWAYGLDARWLLDANLLRADKGLREGRILRICP